MDEANAMAGYKLDGFFEFLSKEFLAEDFYRGRDKKRTDLSRLLGMDKLERLGIPANITAHGPLILEHEPDITVERFGMEILPKFVMPAYAVRSAKNSTGKAVLYCHGHGAGGVADCFVRKGQYHKNLPLALALRGYDVFTFEPAAFGNFTIENFKSDGDYSPCYPLATRLLLYGITAAGLRVYQARRVADYMREKYGVNEYAVAGISGGGLVCMLYGALYDDAYANVISCFSNLFETSIMAIRHCVDNFIPDIFSVGDIPDIIAMNAPKKLLLQSGVNDPIFPIEASKESYARVKGAYKALGIEGIDWETVIRRSVKPGFAEVNIRAFQSGYERQ